MIPARTPASRTTCHAFCRFNRLPRLVRNTASLSEPRDHTSGTNCARPALLMYSRSLSSAIRPNGTTRSFEPLPNKRTTRDDRSRSSRFKSHASEILAPVAYKNSIKARSRISVAESPTIASSRDPTSSWLSGFGTPPGTLTPSIRDVGLSRLLSSDNKKVCIIRIAASLRAVLAFASPEACRTRTYSSTSVSRAVRRLLDKEPRNSTYRVKSRR